MRNNQEHNGLWERLRSGGYSIALVLGACAIALTGFVYYRSTRSSAARVSTPAPIPAVPKPSSGRPAASILEDDPELVPALGTTPTVPETGSPETTRPAPAAKPIRTVCPLEGETAAPYSVDQLCYNETTRDWRVHNGIDLAAEAGARVRAAADGEVYTVYTDDVLGTTVVLRHAGGYTTTYASLDGDPAVEVGQSVTCGQVIGLAGSTALTETALAPHVHFAVARDGVSVDPEAFLAGED